RPRRAAVSSFGLSGTNAHLIVEQAPAAEPTAPSEPDPATHAELALVVSAKTEAALFAQAARLCEHLKAHADLALADVAYSLAATRTHFEHRAAIVGHDRAALLDALNALAKHRIAPNMAYGKAKPEGKLVFVFPGQGSQWHGMARSLLATSEVFCEH